MNPARREEASRFIDSFDLQNWMRIGILNRAKLSWDYRRPAGVFPNRKLAAETAAVLGRFMERRCSEISRTISAAPSHEP
jgi:hypothetical protein